MSRYFLEVSYKGTNYSGFQSQKNANTIQAEVEKAFEILQKAEGCDDWFIQNRCRRSCFAEFFSF